MSRSARWITLAVLAILGAVGYFGYGVLNSNEFTRRLAGKDPFAIRIALLDESDQNSVAGLGQMVIFPENKHIFLYFVDTDAAYPDEKVPISKMSVSSADRFEKYTGIPSKFSLQLNRAQWRRMFDLMGGMDLFLEEPEAFVNAEFQYPQGIHHFPGAQMVEYIYARQPEKDPTRKHLTGIDRVYRMESLFLSLFWNMKKLYKPISEDSLWAVAASIPSSGIQGGEFRSLVKYIASDKSSISVLEIPLEEKTGVNPVIPGGKGLVVKENRARSVFLEFQNTLIGGNFGKGSFMLEVLNGTEVNGLARRVKQNLQIHDVMVMDVDNYPYKPLATSLIVDRKGNTRYTNSLLEMSRLDRDRVYFRRRSVETDLSLFIGDDFNIKKLKVY